MKIFLGICFSALLVLSVAAPAGAGWAKCAGCHTGAIAPAREALKQKFKTLDEFVKGAMAAENAMMTPIKKDTDSIRAAAKEIGYTAPCKKQP